MRAGIVVGIVLFACAPAHAGVISDRSFFSGVEHTFLDFETRGDGSPIVYDVPTVEAFGAFEYADFGVIFEGVAGEVDGGGWFNAPPPAFGTPLFPDGTRGDALDAVGSWPIAIAGPIGGWRLRFTQPVRAVGLGAVLTSFTNEPSLENTIKLFAYDAAGNLLDSTALWEDQIDGGFGGPYANGAFGDEWDQINYGFLGMFADTPIDHLVISGTSFAFFDDLHFSAVPAPGAGAAFALLGLGALTRRRRSGD